MARIEAVHQEGEKKEAVLNALNDQLGDCWAKYTAACHKLQEAEKTLPARMASIQQAIDSLTKELQAIEASSDAASRITGANGIYLTVLIAKVKILRENLSGGVNMYNPLLDLLNGMLCSSILNYLLVTVFLF